MDQFQSHLTRSFGILLHLILWPEPWLEDTPTTLRIWRPSEVMWPSHDDHTTMHHPCHLISRPISWWTWGLRVPTLFIFTLFLCHCANASLLLCSGPMHTCSHSQLRGQLYAPLYTVHIPVPFASMWTATLITDTLQSPSQ